MIFNTPEHTNFPHSGQSPSTIDLLLSHVSSAFDSFTHFNHVSSDHAAVICNIHGTSDYSPKKIFDYKNANWMQYRRIIESKINEISIPNSKNDIDNVIKIFTELVTEARAHSVPVITPHTKNKITPDTKRMISIKY